jgi:hypothetical protein
MNAYEARIEAKRERLEARAERLQKEGTALVGQARKMGEAIPFGQPILVGHHSEKRDRAYRGRIDSKFRKGFETLKVAGEAAARAASVGTGGISSDDPEAIEKLKAELEPLKAKQEEMALANKLVRKGREALQVAGYPDALIAAWLTPSWGGKCRAYEPYQLSNNSANIRRIEQRIEQLAKLPEREAKETVSNAGIKLVENVELNRVQLIFPGKPDAEVRGELKGRGFRWSPTEGAWQRHLNNSGVYAAKCVLEYCAKLA